MASAMPFLRPNALFGWSGWRRPVFIRDYGGAVLCVAVATATRLVIEPWVTSRIPYMLYLPAILVAAAFLGTGPAIAAALLSVVVSSVLFEVIVPDALHLIGLGVFGCVSLGIIALTRPKQRVDPAADHATATLTAAPCRTNCQPRP